MPVVRSPATLLDKLLVQVKRCCKLTDSEYTEDRLKLTSGQIVLLAWSMRELGCNLKERSLLDDLVEAAESRIDEFSQEQEKLLLSSISALLPS